MNVCRCVRLFNGCSSVEYLLEVLVLHAFEDYMTAAAAAATASSISSQDPSDAAALEGILHSFLRLAARLPDSDVISAGRISACSWLYNEEAALQIIMRPEFARVLRPRGCEHHPIVLDPADPTHNVAAAVTELGIEVLAGSAQAQLAFRDLKLAGWRSKPPRARIQQQIDALCLHQRILADAGDVQWDITPRGADLWLPFADVRVMANLTHKDVPDLVLHLLTRPMRDYDHDPDRASGTKALMMGVELRLANSHVVYPLLRTLSELPPPLRVTICKGSSVEFIRRPRDSMSPFGSSSGSFASPEVIVLESDIVGKLGADAGPSWMLSRQVDKLVPLANPAPGSVCMVQYKLRLSFKVA